MPLPVEGGVQPLQHRVECVGEFLQLIPGTDQGDAFVQVAPGDPPCCVGDVPYRVERPAGHQPAKAHGCYRYHSQCQQGFP